MTLLQGGCSQSALPSAGLENCAPLLLVGPDPVLLWPLSLPLIQLCIIVYSGRLLKEKSVLLCISLVSLVAASGVHFA